MWLPPACSGSSGTQLPSTHYAVHVSRPRRGVPGARSHFHPRRRWRSHGPGLEARKTSFFELGMISALLFVTEGHPPASSSAPQRDILPSKSDLGPMIPGSSQSNTCPDGPWISRSEGGHVDGGGAIGQPPPRGDTGGRHQAPAQTLMSRTIGPARAVQDNGILFRPP